ncbi:MAG: hypothetical protein Q9163_004812 [Psora crenata]
MLLSAVPQGFTRLVVLAISFGTQHSIASPAINVALQASFNAPPYLLELLETAAEENTTAYYPLLDRIAEGRFAECGTDEELYNDFLQVLKDDGHIASDEFLSSFQFALSIHSAAPRIEAHYQYYDTSIAPSLMVAQDAACPVWVHFNGKQYCSPTLERAQQDVGAIRDPDSLPFDRILSEPTKPDAEPSILYADITSPLFGQFHQTLIRTARSGETSYRIRYRPSASSSEKPLAISGYGVELSLKRTDYIVIDDRKADTEEKEQPESSEEDVVTGEAEKVVLEPLDEEIADLKPLTAKELSGLGLKTASFIMASEHPFETLIKVSQDFPKHSSAISKRNISRELFSEHRSNRDAFLPAGYNVIWMNGQQVQSRQMDAFALLEQLRRERSIVGNLQPLNFTGSQAVQVLSHNAIAASKIEGDSQRYDYRDSLEGGKVIIWLNDIEKDKRYSDWPDHTSALLQRTWPGQLPQVRRDIHNVVMPMDLANAKDIEVIVETLQMVIKRKVPIRFGIVPITATQAAIDQAKVVYHLWDTYGLSAIFAYLELCMKSKGPATAQKGSFDAAIKGRKLRLNQHTMNFQDVIESDGKKAQSEASPHNQENNIVAPARSIDDTKHYLQRLGADTIPAPFFANGVAMPWNDAWLQSMSSRIDMDLRTIQRQVYEGAVSEDTWLAGTLIENAPTHRNALIIPEDETSIKIIDVGSILSKHGDIYHNLPYVAHLPSKVSLEHFAPHILVVADLDTKEGAALLLEAAKFQVNNGDVELVFAHSPGGAHPAIVSTAIWGRMHSSNRQMEAVDLEGIIAEESVSESQETFDHAERFWGSCQPLIRGLGLDLGQQAVYLNGRVVGPIPTSATFTEADFEHLLQFERSKRLIPAEQVLTMLGLHERIKSPIDSAILSSTIALSTISEIPEGIFESAPTLRMDKFNSWESSHTMIETGDRESSLIQLVASIDPTSQIAQRWIHILKVLSELSGVHLRLFLNPREKMQELPIKRFYRHVLDSKPSFTRDGTVQGLRATFHGVPREALLNVGLDVPPAWLVAPKESIHDLDNIKLSALKDGADVDALYELEYILIEGHSRDVTIGQGQPPRGVQLLLGTAKDPHFADTIIMANLGYFQFKANPGYWNLRLQPGRSSQIFKIDSAGQLGYNPAPGDESTDITLMSFQGRTLYPRLSRKPGQESEDVLEESGSSLFKSSTPGSYLNKAGKLASSLLSTLGVAPRVVRHADINIFSVASGHLYERMLSIMMVSVMRHTTHTVKFWFIAQFLSPSFKASLPTLAAHYHFDYELVTYKWPHWLRAQSEKQREIWGYKILFLDVLFPTSLDKVIFVDADQIVRTDMYELIQLDLEGAPYAFTPMCDSRTSMEGFRFWKTGYWANFLRGLPYHISALYVVDLVKFRQIAAGDRLRGQYHQLSADPASLSNLDQDLPNHMQHVLQIKSLPQDWLWCETWCSDEALASAKTIDLCNNPQTKEPKLKRARRQVPEWTVYDEEIAAVLEEARNAGARVRGGVQEVMVEGSAGVGGKKTKDEL